VRRAERDTRAYVRFEHCDRFSSDDGGRSWNDATKIAGPMMESWLVPTFAGEMVANYNSAVFVDGKPYGAFAIARPPDPKTGQFDEAIYAVRLPKGRD
jgi:hypothetical protein